MDKAKLKDSILKTVSEKLSSNKSILSSDLKQLSHDISQSIVSRFQLVTQEEFQTQKKILVKAQTKISELQARLKAFEDKANK